MLRKCVGVRSVSFDPGTNEFMATIAIYDGCDVRWTNVAVQGHRRWSPRQVTDAFHAHAAKEGTIL